MPDYGHELEFGIFPSPDADRAEQTLELAQLADVTGLDLVSVQDHPYQGRHLDTWTLLSVIAARTSAVRVAPNVANLPLRHPVVLARSAATLDLLSGGRVELGLGAGAFWEAIEALGGPRRTPKQAVDALVEAIGVIRASWAGGTIRLEGEHYPVRGAHGGPAAGPRHPDLGGRLQAADAAGHRRPGRRLDPVDGVRRPAGPRGHERHHRRARGGQRPRRAGDPADVQRLRPLRQRRQGSCRGR